MASWKERRRASWAFTNLDNCPKWGDKRLTASPHSFSNKFCIKSVLMGSRNSHGDPSPSRLAREHDEQWPAKMMSTFILSLKKYVYTKNEGKSEDDGSERFLESHLSSSTSTRVKDESNVAFKWNAAAFISLLWGIWPISYFSGQVVPV